MVGVVALFARHGLHDETLRALASVASSIAQTIERARAQERVRLSQQWFATNLRSIGDGVIATDRQGRVRFANHVATTLTGWPMDEALGNSLHDVFTIVDEDSRAVAESPLPEVLREGGIVGYGEPYPAASS